MPYPANRGHRIEKESVFAVHIFAGYSSFFEVKQSRTNGWDKLRAT
jgi:hypothetical protein